MVGAAAVGVAAAVAAAGSWLLLGSVVVAPLALAEGMAVALLAEVMMVALLAEGMVVALLAEVVVAALSEGAAGVVGGSGLGFPHLKQWLRFPKQLMVQCAHIQSPCLATCAFVSICIE